MKKTVYTIFLLILLVAILLVFTGCSSNEENSLNNIDSENINKVEEQIEEKDEPVQTLSESEALDIGYDLHEYGLMLSYKDNYTGNMYIGKSKTLRTNYDIVDTNYLQYEMGTNEDIDNYFTEKRIKELEEQNSPYKIKKINDKWYLFLQLGDRQFDYIGSILTVKSIEENKIVFKQTDYLSDDFVTKSSNGLIQDDVSYEGKRLDEYIDDFKSKYKCETEEYEFIIVKEGNYWKIDSQVLENF